jgi:hypothetical protein
MTLRTLLGLETQLPRSRVAERDHLPELPLRIDVQQRERRLGRKERLAHEMQEHARILAARVEQNGFSELGRDLAQDKDRFRFEIPKMRGERFRQGSGPPFAGTV